MLDVIQVPTKCYRQIIIHENRMLTRTLTSFWEKMRQYFKFVGMKIKLRGGGSKVQILGQEGIKKRTPMDNIWICRPNNF